MPAILLPSVCNQQPQGVTGPNWTNPLNRGLVFLYNAASGNPVSSDLITGKRPTRFNGSGTAAPKMSLHHTQAGKSVNWLGSEDFGLGWESANLHPSQSPTAACTMLAFFNRGTGTTFYGRSPFMRRWGTGDPYASMGLTIHPGARGENIEVAFVGTQVGAPATPTADSSGLNLLVPHVSAAVFDGAQSLLSHYAFGKLINTAATPSNSIVYNPYPLWVGNGDDILPFEGDVYMTAMWNRALSASEIKSLSDNPWQLFAPTPKKEFKYNPPVTDKIYSLPSFTRTQQPQQVATINNNSPLTRNILLLWNAPTDLLNLVDGQIGTEEGSGTSKEVFKEGVAKKFTKVVSTGISWAIPSKPLNSSFSGFIVCKPVVNGQNNTYFDYGGTAGGWGFRINAVNEWHFVKYGVIDMSTNLNASNAEPVVVVFSYSSSTGYVNVYSKKLNSQVYEESINSTPNTDNIEPGLYSSITLGNPRAFDAPEASIFAAGVWSVALSSTQIKQILDNPWHLFAPAQRRTFSDVTQSRRSLSKASYVTSDIQV